MKYLSTKEMTSVSDIQGGCFHKHDCIYSGISDDNTNTTLEALMLVSSGSLSLQNKFCPVNATINTIDTQRMGLEANYDMNTTKITFRLNGCVKR